VFAKDITKHRRVVMETEILKWSNWIPKIFKQHLLCRTNMK